MNNELVKIGDVEIPVKEYHGQRVVTFKDIDQCHGRPEGTAGRNFRANRKHMIESTDFFKITADEFRRLFGELDSRHQTDITVITESGYLMLVKSFTDDLAWDIQRALINNYFNVNTVPKDYPSTLRALADKYEENQKLMEANAQQKQIIEEQTPKANYYDIILNSKNAVSITKIAKDYGKSAMWLNEFLHKHKVQFKQGNTWLLYQKYATQGYTKSETVSYINSNGETCSSIHTKWTQKGRLFIYELLKKYNVYPLIDINGSKGK